MRTMMNEIDFFINKADDKRYEILNSLEVKYIRNPNPFLRDLEDQLLDFELSRYVDIDTPNTDGAYYKYREFLKDVLKSDDNNPDFVKFQNIVKKYAMLDDENKLVETEESGDLWSDIADEAIKEFGFFKDNNFSEKVGIYYFTNKPDYETERELIALNADVWTKSFNFMIDKLNEDPKNRIIGKFSELDWQASKYNPVVLKNHEEVQPGYWGYQSLYPDWEKAFVLSIEYTNQEDETDYLEVRVPVTNYSFSKDLKFNKNFYSEIEDKVIEKVEELRKDLEKGKEWGI